MLPSLNVPLAVNLIEVPFAMCALAGFTVIAINFAVDTVKVVDPLTKKVEPKSMYCERLDETVVCGGIYKQ